MLAGNKSDTYALFLYPDDEQKMLHISYNHTNMSKIQAKPQTGFNRGDTSPLLKEIPQKSSSTVCLAIMRPARTSISKCIKRFFSLLLSISVVSEVAF